MLSGMADVKSRREEYAEATRQALIDSAGELFAARGYHATSIEDVVRRARVTRGALYHHFAGKQELFEAVFEEQEARVAGQIAAAFAREDDALRQALAGLDAFLDACLDERFREIILRQGPTALGWVRWRELDQRYTLGLLRTGLRALMDERVIRPHSLDLLTRVFFAALSEAAIAIAEAGDPTAARDEAAGLVRAFLESLR